MAVETVGNWYWIVDEIEAAGMVPRLVHARRAKGWEFDSGQPPVDKPVNQGLKG